MIAVLALLPVLVIGCAGEEIYSSKLLKDVKLSSQLDERFQPVAARTVFQSDVEKIYCSFTASGVPVGSEIAARWVYVGQGSIDDAYIIDQFIQTKMEETRMAMFLLRPVEGWQKGDYWVALFIDQQPELQISFTIK